MAAGGATLTFKPELSGQAYAVYNIVGTSHTKTRYYKWSVLSGSTVITSGTGSMAATTTGDNFDVSISGLSSNTSYTFKYEYGGSTSYGYENTSTFATSFHYAYYDLSTSSYYTGYSNKTTSATSITASAPSGWAFQGYVFWDTRPKCIGQGEEEDYDGTSLTCSRHSAANSWVVYFFKSGQTTYTLHSTWAVNDTAGTVLHEDTFTSTTAWTQTTAEAKRSTWTPSATQYIYNTSTAITHTGTDYYITYKYLKVMQVYHAYFRITTGISSYTVTYNNVDYTCDATHSPDITMLNPTSDTLTVKNWVLASGYRSPVMYYNVEDETTWTTDHSIDIKGLGSKGITSMGYTRYIQLGAVDTAIASFSWTNTIASGQPVKNLTAADWKKLQDKIDEVRGTAYSDWTRATQYGALTAAMYNQVRLRIIALGNYGTITSAVSQGSQILASKFNGNGTTSDYSIRAALNRAIAYVNAP